MFRYDPFDDMRRVQSQMNRMFGGFWEPQNQRRFPAHAGCGIVPREEGVQSPFIDVRDTGESVVITADMPGVEKDDVNISVRDGVLEISTEIGDEVSEENETEGFVRRERYYTSYHRRIPLPATVDDDGATATLNNGVLEVTLPKVDEEDTRKNIKVE